MGYDCSNVLAKGTKLPDVEEFLKLLGYHRQNKGSFYQFIDHDYRHVNGIAASIRKDNDLIVVDTHTWGYRSKAEAEIHNRTIKQLRKRFGGSFTSDQGKGRYLPLEGEDLSPAEAGCARAYSAFGHSVIRVNIYLQSRHFEGPHWQHIGVFEPSDQINPILLSNNFLTTYFVAMIEDYFKSTFVALLRYSERRGAFFKSARIHPEDLLAVSNQQQSIEEAIAKGLNFQNLDRTFEIFRTLDPKLDLAGYLRRPYRRRKQSLYDSLTSMIQRRHDFVHRNLVDTSYKTEEVRYDLANIKVGLARIYKGITKHYGWKYVVTWFA